MKNFALIGLAGFVAKKHVKCIMQLKGNLVAALDKHDNVGFIDSFFPKCEFFKNEEKFFLYVKNKKIDYVVICSPSYLHFNHIKQSLLSGSNVIVEKPPVIKFQDYEKILKLEKKTKKKCFCIFQLRLDKKLKKLKKDINQKNTKYNVGIKYYTYRGNWYFKSWKNSKKYSGGLLVNIAIHFFDILLWIFGDFKKIEITKKKDSHVEGTIVLEKAIAKWIVSIENLNNKNNKIKSKYYRIMKINKKIINFDKFNDLHLTNYKEIIKGNFHISKFVKIIKLLSVLK
jgi:UDP-N-acetyl-2-amino-2-deoxyglucuronate dehydrogenase